jgi:hypothetical protein
MYQINPIKFLLLLLVSLLFCNFSMANTIVPPSAVASLFIQTVDLSKEIQLQYRYVNGILKYIVIKNSGKPVVIDIFEQKKVIGTGETYVMTPPSGVSKIRINIRSYSTEPDTDIFNLSKELVKQTYLLFLP